MKISIIGAGAVGATCLDEIAKRELVDELVLLDIKENVAEGKALDMYQATSTNGINVRIKGVTNNYHETKDSHLIIITSGIPRKPGMTREELIGTNAKIIKDVLRYSLEHSPNAIFLVVSNPVDTLALLALQTSDLPKNRVLGLGGALDTSRFKCYLSLALNCAIADLQALVIGGHGDTTMIPLIHKATYQCKPVTEILSKEICDQIVADTMAGGATLTKLIGTSAWYGPGAAVANMAASIIRNERRVIPCSIYLEGEYGEQGIFMGAPVVLGKNGVEQIIELNLSEKEKALYKQSAESIRKTNAILKSA